MRLLRQVLLASLLLLPAAARAQSVVTTLSWMHVLLGHGGEGEGRQIAFELHSVLDVNPRPPPPLTEAGWWARPGAEARLFFGMRGGSMELLLSAGWLVSGLDAKGIFRPGIGVTYNLPIGSVGTLYGLGSVGAWINTRGEMDAWGPRVAGESRLALGARFRVTRLVSMVVELDATTLSVERGNLDPFLGLRLGWSFSPADPEREALREKRRKERVRRRSASRYRW